MAVISKKYNVYNNLGYWFMGSLVLVFLGFYRSYFQVLFEPQQTIIHFHFLLMIIWIGMLIVQPFLIKYKRLSTHRMIGKLSYVVVPLTAITAFMLIRYGYYKSIGDLTGAQIGNTAKYTPAEVSGLAAEFSALPFVYLVWLVVFYSLAIINKKNTHKHSRYMLAAGLTITGPTVDRIFSILLNISVFPFGLPVESFSYFLIDLILALLLWKDYRENRNVKTLWTCLAIYAIIQVLYFTCPDTNGWETMIEFLMQPAP